MTAVSMRHVLEQGPMLKTLGGAALTVWRRHDGKAKPTWPGDWLTVNVAPPSASLVRAFVKSVGGDPSSYRNQIPPHLFPQWALPVAFKVLSRTPYPLTRVMNAGSSFEVRAPLSASEPLVVRARLESIDDDGARAIVTTRIVTGTASSPDALVSDVRVFVPLASKPEEKGSRKKRDGRGAIPSDARELAFLRLGPGAGLDFALLTGDFNPIHWVPTYARWSGFRSCIMHGFGTLALSVEAICRRALSGNIRALEAVDARFVRPLVLPAKVGVYVGDVREGRRELFVGRAPGSVPYLVGSFVIRGEEAR